ncbi:MAG: VanW family protein [Candidatus Margulisbacteria bacterium]|nr:VanW family protein [Candidatus Margulisiibacteriota bacterium]MBU1021996.1 VanW family protein [Candidatus Margulisiibacteriota bacterium]MBU1728974.1 VanW family protein [Candidatus Margulisiibacteriota bacterium]MBU1954780.1 VanW family protein [Candidatus Margulisiibacteriota bacterium]
MKHFVFKLLVVLAVLSLLGAVGLIIGDYVLTRARLPYNTFIESVNVSLLTQGEAIRELKALPADDIITSPLIAYYKDKDFFLLPSDLGIKIDARASVKNAFKQTHDKNYIKELRSRLSKEFIRFPLVLSIDEARLAETIASIAEKIDREPRDATIILHGQGAYNIKKHQTGRTLNIEKTIQNIKASLEKDERLLPLAVSEEIPRVTYEELAKAPPVQLLSEYTTYYGTHDSPNRIHNIKLIATEFIDGTILLSGEAFSLVDTVGEINREAGFKQAFVIVEGELVPQYGGGTCQIATTLYNTVMLADLDVLQRRNHSLYFYIYPLGRDATVYGKALDFRFVNNTGNPVYFKANATNKSLTFKIFGTPTGKVVTFTSPQVVYRGKDGEKSSGWRAPKNTPFSTTVTRTVKKDGKVLETEVIRSYYKLVGDGSNVVIRRPEPR